MTKIVKNNKVHTLTTIVRNGKTMQIYASEQTKQLLKIKIN